MSEPRIIPVGGELPPLVPRERPAGLDAARRNGTAKRTPAQRRDAVRRRFGLLNALLDVSLPTLGRVELAAWLLLYRHAGPDGTVTASVGDLARRAGCSYRAMRRGLKRLHAAGLLDRAKRGTLAGGPSLWRLRTPDGGRP